MSDSRNPEFEREQQKARDGLQTVSEIRQKLDILAEHVESRKEALEEEIQEQLHESLANANDSMERIQENIAPKVERAIRTKMEDIDRKMERLKEEGLEAVRAELEQATPDIALKIMEDLDKQVAEHTRFTKMEILSEVRQELDKLIQSALEPVKEKQEKGLSLSKTLSALALAGVVLLGITVFAIK